MNKDSDTTQPALRLSPAAVARIRELQAEKKQGEQLMLRTTIDSGGCKGFQYSFDLTETSNPEDIVCETDGVKVVVDKVSMDLLQGSEIDFVEEMIGATFVIRNPQASSSCGCGNSFSI